MKKTVQHLLATMPPRERAQLQAALDAGWKLEHDWRRIRMRYVDLDLAEAVPKPIIWADLGVLIGTIVQLEAALRDAGYEVAAEPAEEG